MPPSGTHGREQRLHVLVGVRDRGQVDQVPVQDLLVPVGERCALSREPQADPTQRKAQQDSLAPQLCPRDTTQRTPGPGQAAECSATQYGAGWGVGFCPMTKYWKDPKVVAKGEMPPSLFRGGWGQAILQVTLTLGQLDSPIP